MYLSMCAGDELEQVNQVTMYDPSKGNKKEMFKFTQEIDFIFKFEYRNVVLSRDLVFKKKIKGDLIPWCLI